ncbi:hypothetical protein J41TS12_21280 [Paenibacillus antibioticophila]|uniref:Phosphoadenosine phosphosulphate reductase domain-containing protein n=1 Tax=Paenibacillus antibioticophila TaxID=1274374 RepID=A0A919XV85_9BACL|nr:phosphoadenosine phosphosulfate reductase family protein [Paenibacillus antibioticophila]GIO37267.1 hypothetical protein J41TS12_21280 [Paenibacillus antibioticophila]
MLDDKIRSATLEVLKAYADESDQGAWQIAYSGGKDSSVNASVIFRAVAMISPAKRTRKLYLVTSSTGVDFTTEPTKLRELDKMQQYINDSGLPVEIVKVQPLPQDSFPFLVLGLGYPLPKTKRNRWCTTRMKLKPQQAAKKYTKATRDALGVRLSESTSRRESIEQHQADGEHYHGDNGEIYPIIDFTLDDIWSYSAKHGYAWGDAEEVSNLYKDATGECGLRKKKAGADEKTDDPCGARFGCVVCPVVTIDKSTQQMAKTHPYFQPFVELRNLMIEMYKQPKNRAGKRRNGQEMKYGQGTFTVKARMELYKHFLKAEEDHRYLCLLHGVEPQSMFTDQIMDMIRAQWEKDLRDKPYLEDAPKLDLFYAEIDGKDGWQMTINTDHESLYKVSR